MVAKQDETTLENLMKELANEMKKYHFALEENASFDVKKAIRTNMRRVQQEIAELKNKG